MLDLSALCEKLIFVCFHIRPWYKEAVSAPVDLVMVTDTSTSMAGVLKYAQAAAKQVLNTLGPNDKVSYLPCSCCMSSHFAFNFNHVS